VDAAQANLDTNTPSVLTATKEGARRLEEYLAAVQELETALRRLYDFVKKKTG
jgi:hypothetical protein